MGAVITVWILSLGVSQTAGVALSSSVQLCTDTCVKTGMCEGPTLPDMIACHINTGNRKDKGFQKQNGQEHGVPTEVTEIGCVTGWGTRGSPRCLFELCTLFVGPKLASERRPPPWELRDVADTVYNCTKGDNHGKPSCIRGKDRGTHGGVGDGYEEYKAGKETIYVKEYTTEKTWDQAAQQCCSDGARLIKLDRKEKNEAIKQYEFQHWIGLKDMYDNDTFFWTDGSPLSFKAWFFKEPSHLSQINRKENCAEISRRLAMMAWNDSDCNHTYPFLCEKLF